MEKVKEYCQSLSHSKWDCKYRIVFIHPKVGSPLSINSIREDLGYHHGTIVTWIDILSRLYLIFTIRPWHRNLPRSIYLLQRTRKNN